MAPFIGGNMNYYFFPYDEIDEHSKVILWGAGNVGRNYYQQLKDNQYCDIVLVVDKNYKSINWEGVAIHNPVDILDCDYDYVIVSVTDIWANSILKDLKKLGIPSDKWVFKESIFEETFESKIVQEIFRLLNIDCPSYFDVGACHPHIASNTMGLYLNGSRGVNVEPNIQFKQEFNIYRFKDINVFLGIDVTEGEKVFMKSDDPYLSTFSEGAAKWLKDHHHAQYIENVLCKTITLNSLSERYFGGRMPDYLDIDIEGLDEAVLEQVDFSSSSPIVICAEGCTPKLNEILLQKKCEGGGYHPYCRYSANTIYVRKDKYAELMYINFK